MLVEEKKMRFSLCGIYVLKCVFMFDDFFFKVCLVRMLKRKRVFKFRWLNVFFCSRNGFFGFYFVYVCVCVNVFIFFEGKFILGVVMDLFRSF